MRVIKHGKLYERNAVCDNCGCEFAYLNEDIGARYTDGFDEEEQSVRVTGEVTCPECRSVVRLHVGYIAN